MKTIACLIFAIPSLLFGQASPVKDYPMRNIPKDDPRFQSVLQSLNSQRNHGNKEVITIIQHSSGSDYLARIGESPSIVLLKNVEGKWADNDQFQGTASPTGDLYEYSNVLGAKRTVRVFTMLREITPDELILRLKNGETFSINKGMTNVPCTTCEGRKTATINGKKTYCRTCSGQGVATVPQRVNVLWGVAVPIEPRP